MAAASVTGFYRTASGAVYRFFSEQEYTVAVYHEPSARQAATGIVRGDLAYKATLVGKVLVGTFHQRHAIEARERCPGLWQFPSTLCLEVSEDSSQLKGTLLEEHLMENECRIDDRRLSILVFDKIIPEKPLIKPFEQLSGSSGG